MIPWVVTVERGSVEVICNSDISSVELSSVALSLVSNVSDICGAFSDFYERNHAVFLPNRQKDYTIQGMQCNSFVTEIDEMKSYSHYCLSR